MRPRLFINFKFFFLSKNVNKYVGNIDRCQRPLSMVRKGIDKVILIKHPSIIEIVNWYLKNKYINKDQILWVKAKKWDEKNIEKQIINLIKKHYHNVKATFVIHQLSNNIIKEIQKLISKNGGRISKDFIYPQKNCLYKTPSGVIPNFYIGNLVSAVKGYWCRDKNELESAYKLLKKKGIKKMVIKPIGTSAGNGIEYVESFNDIKKYKLIYGDVVLEEKIDLYKILPAAHFKANKQYFGVNAQVLKGNAFSGITNQEEIKEEIIKKCKKIIKVIKHKFNLKGYWGVDFLVDKKMNVYLNDINAGRLNGSHPPKYFIKNNFPNKKVRFIAYNIVMYKPLKVEMGKSPYDRIKRKVNFKNVIKIPLCYYQNKKGDEKLKKSRFLIILYQ
jgi:hypothetical protein